MRIPLPHGLHSSSPQVWQQGFLLKALFFTIWGASGLYFPYINVYYRQIGLSGTQIGLIGMLGSLVAAFAAMLWGMLNDRMGKSRLLFSLACLGSIFFVIVLAQMQTFGLILLAAALFSLFNRPAFSLVDSTSLKMLGANRQSYGNFRLWGTIGFIVTSSLSGFLLERAGLHSMFMIYPIGLLVFWAVTQRLPDEPIEAHSQERGGLMEMLRQPAWLLFAASVLILWSAAMASMSFMGVVINDMGGAASLWWG